MNTKLIILGVNHSYQLVSRECQPGVYREFIDRVNPTAIGIERSPESFARFDYYDFTYEQQEIVIPYALNKGIPTYPFDWTPDSDDQQLAWHVSNIDEPHFFRANQTLSSFHYFPKTDEDFYYSERPEVIDQINQWIDTKMNGERDFPRRLFQYRTYMQAMRIKQIVKAHKGGTVLVVVGHMHKHDIEQCLSQLDGIDIIQPSKYGHLKDHGIHDQTTPKDLYAISAFNLLGIQADQHVDVEWVTECVQRLESQNDNLETRLFRIKLDLQKQALPIEKAIEALQSLNDSLNGDEHFTYTGIKDPQRIDSFFDPFGNLTVKSRVKVELAKLYAIANIAKEVTKLKTEVTQLADLTNYQLHQFNYYWDEFVTHELVNV